MDSDVRGVTSHPLFLISIAILLLNDHVLKGAYGSWWTGKLSDLAGLVLAPLFLVGLYQWITGSNPSRRTTVGLAVLVAVGFAVVKILPWGEAVYEVGLASLQWPFRAIAAAVRGITVPGIDRVDLVRDATDLIALPFAFVVLMRWPRARPTQVRLLK